MDTKVSSFFPEFGTSLANYKGSEVVSRLGKSAIQETVCGVLLGKNIRSLTEGLTRRRIALCSAAVLNAYLNAAGSIPDFENRLISLVGQEYNEGKLSKAESMFLLWMLGLTNKGVQNILRGDKNEALKEYAESTKSALESAAKKATEQCGELSGELVLGGKTLNLNWKNLTQIFTVIGAQTLAIRGSEKSMYGKLFEKLVMGTLLSILGFKNIKPGQNESPSMLFWLSQREDKRDIAQIVQRLQNQYLEHHHHIKWSASGIALAFMVVYDLKISAEFLPRHKFFQARQHIAVLRQIIQTIVYVK